MIERQASGSLSPALATHIKRHVRENGADGHWFMYQLPASASLDAVKNADAVWTFVDHRQVRGHVQVTINPAAPHRCTLSMGVELGWRGKGHGRRLMQTAVGWCRWQHGLRWIDGWAMESNKAVLELDYSVGFRSVGVIPDCMHGDGQHILVLDLLHSGG